MIPPREWEREVPAFFRDRAPAEVVDEAGDRAALSAGDRTLFAFRRNVVVAASAGTGKTHRLTALYVLLALGLTSMGQSDDATPAPPVPPERIVATTFSRAAALEIRTRIERALASIAAWDGSVELPFAEAIAARKEALGLRLPVGELREQAAEALAKWSSARVDTLHGVARRIVQRHALAIGLAPGSRVLDEEEAETLGNLAVDEALGAALEAGGEHADAARALVAACGGVALARLQVVRMIDRLDEEGIAPADLTLENHAAEARDLAERLRRVARDCAAGASASLRDAAVTLAGALGPPGIGGAELLPEAAIPSLLDLFTRRMPAAKKRTPADDELDELLAVLSGKTKGERAAGLVALLRDAPQLDVREKRLCLLLEDARARFGAAKRRAGGLGFGDLLRLARDGLRDRPSVARAVRGTLDVLLVDELQDTSRVQRDLIYLLRERDDAGRAPGAPPTAEGLAGAGLFLVGDRKQSIYGFRGADVAVFARVCAELAGPAAAEALALAPGAFGSGAVADFVALRESRRSGERILDFVNAFAERDFVEGRAAGAAPRDFEITYGPAERLVPHDATPVAGAELPDLPAPRAPRPSEPRASASGSVILVQDDGRSPDDAAPIVRESAGPAREAHVAAAFVAREVAGASGTSFKHVAILARRRSTIPFVELALARLDIPYVVAGRALYDAAEIRDVAALLRLLLDPRDRLALATVLRGPMVALSDTALAALSIPGRGLSFPLLGRPRRPETGADDAAALALLAFDLTRIDPVQRARLEGFRARYADLRRTVLRLPPGEAIRASVAGFDLDRVLAALPRAEARIGNVDRLVAIARRKAGTLSGFSRWLDRRIHDEADEPEAAVFSPDDDAVRLTTIHASKGLDFPVVVLVDLNAEPRAGAVGVGFVPASGGEAPFLFVRHFTRRPSLHGEERLAGGEGPLMALATHALRKAQADARAREHAERRRITYVAVTRARRTLALIGSAATPRAGSAWRTLSAGGFDDVLATEDACALLAAARPAPRQATAGPSPSLRPPVLPAQSTAQTLAVNTTALSVFQGCARRFRFRQLLGLEEPVESGQLDLFSAGAAPPPEDPPLSPLGDDERDPRAEGRAAHRVLERWPRERFGEATRPEEVVARLAAEGLPLAGGEAARIAEGIARFLSGPYAVEIRATGAALRREEPFVLNVLSSGPVPRSLALRGVIDLVVDRPGGAIDVIDYKLSPYRSDLTPYEFQVRSYALAVQRAQPDRRVRAGVLFLGRGEPSMVRAEGEGGAFAPEEHDRFERVLGALAHRLAEARHADRFDGVPVEECVRLRCGFVRVCHGPQAAPAGQQASTSRAGGGPASAHGPDRSG